MKFNKGEIICREDLGYPEGALVCDGYDTAGGLLAHRIGGGSQLTVPAREEMRFRVVTDEEKDAALFRRGSFALADTEKSFDGWSNCQMWNGWEMPRFEFQACKEILGWIDDNKARYDAVWDASIQVNDDGEDEVWPVESITITNGTQIKTHDLGAGTWMWDCEPQGQRERGKP